jgi:hypothetical protein
MYKQLLTYVTTAYLNPYLNKKFLAYVKFMESANVEHLKYMIHKSSQPVKFPGVNEVNTNFCG